MSISETGTVPTLEVPQKTRDKESWTPPSSPQALALTRCSTDTSLTELQKTKFRFGTLKHVCSHEKPSHYVKKRKLYGIKGRFCTKLSHKTLQLLPSVCLLVKSQSSVPFICNLSHAQSGSIHKAQKCKCACVEYYSRFQSWRCSSVLFNSYKQGKIR